MTAALALVPDEHPATTIDSDVGCIEFLNRAGITFRRLDYWSRTGILRPSSSATPGSGLRRTWPATEIPVAALIAHLTAHGLDPRVAEPIARDLLTTGHATFAGLRLDLTQEP